MKDSDDGLAAYAALRRNTIPGLLLERTERTPDEVAYRAKHYGIYRERTWREYSDLVAACARGFESLGLKPGERVAIMGDACEEWVLADMAALALGAVTYGIYPTASASEMDYQMRDGGAVIFVAENQEYVDKILPLLDDLPDVRHVVVVDTTAMFMYEHRTLISFDEIMEGGREAATRQPEKLAEDVARLDPTAPAFVVYTSGTTGHPKGAVISHGKHLAAAYTFLDRYPQLRDEAHRVVVYLPLCHILGRNDAITLPLLTHIVPHYGESLEDLPTKLFEVAPTFLITVPRYLQKFASQILVGIENTTPIKRAVYELAARVGRRYARVRWDGRGDGLLGVSYRLLYALAFRPILNKIGLDQLRLVLCGGAPLPPETMALWHVYGVNVSELYGQTETTGALITGQAAHFPRPGNIGKPPAGWEVVLSPDNEILVKSADLFDGYWNRPDATREAIDDEGWLHTGDIGEWADGNLRIIDRAKDIIVTSGGKTLSPTFIENILRSSLYISEAIVFGHERPYVSALLEIDYDTVSDWARSHDVTYTGFTNLTEQPQVLDLLGREVDRANEELGRVEQIKSFRVLPKELDPEEEGEPVTPTRKVKRKLMYERFQDLVDSMYGQDEARLIASGIGDMLGNGENAGADGLNKAL